MIPMRRPLLAAVFCLVMAVLAVVWIDYPLARVVRTFDQSVLGVARVLSSMGNSAWVLVPLGLILLLRLAGWLRGLSAGLVSRFREAFWMVVATGLLADLLKGIVARPRPGLWLREGLTDPRFFHWFDAAWASMPSGHTVTAFTLACLAARWRPALTLPAFVLAVAVALARVTLGAHYLSDVLVGAALTFLIFAVIRRASAWPGRAGLSHV